MIKTTGIYKITSPSGKVYIGQSIWIERRFNNYQYLTSKLKEQRKLYNSLNKYNSINHKFEILEICNKEDLDNKECYYINFYNSIKTGLNIREGGSNKNSCSIETRKLLSEIHKKRWKNLSPELKEKYILRLKNESPKGSLKALENGKKAALKRKGKKLSEDHKLAIRLNSPKSYSIEVFKNNIWVRYSSIRSMSKDIGLDRCVFKYHFEKNPNFIWKNMSFRKIATNK
jgi:group I intron endonuclease